LKKSLSTIERSFNVKIGFFWCSLLVGWLAAQSTGALRGIVTDQSGAVIPGAVVKATDENGQVKSTGATDNGSFRLIGLAPGHYSVEASAPGFAQARPAVVLVPAGEITLNLALHIQVQAQEVTVTDTTAPEVSTDPTQSASAQVLRDDALDSISDDADDMLTDLQTLAGPAAGLNGAQIFIDGFTAGDGVLPAKDAIREVRINQNPFAPEYDTLGTGHIEILTKPGSDQLRGSAYYTYGNDALNSRNPYAAEKAPFTLEDIGGSISGPIHSHGSFSLDLDYRKIDNGEVISAVTLNPSTLAATPFTGIAVSPMRRLYLGARLDYQLNSKNTLTIRYEPSYNSSDNGGIGNFTLPSESYRSTFMEYSLQATETATLGANTVNETRFQFRHQNVTQTPEDDAPSIVVANSFNGGGATAGLHDFIHHHYEVQNYTTRIARAHIWKFGARLRAVSIKDTSEQNFNGTYTFGGAYAPVLDSGNQPVAPGIMCNPNAPSAGCATISSIEQYRRTILFGQMGYSPQVIRELGGGATQFSLNTGDPVVYVGGVDIGVFAGDDWNLKPNLTLSLGARYETQENISDRSDIAPRLAFAWAPGRSNQTAPKTVIRGGFGIFYDRFSEQNVLVAQRYNGLNQAQYILSNPNTFPAVPSMEGLASSLAAIHSISSDLRAPYLMQSSIGVERQLPAKTTLAVTYTNSHGLHELLTRNINAPLIGTYSGVPGSGVFPFPGKGPIYEMESAGVYNQNQLITTVNSRINAKISLIGTYTLASARSNTDGLSTFPANQYSLAGEYGPAANDVRNRVSIGGSITSKWNLQWSPLIILQSGLPFNITTSQDIYGDTVLSARPGFATSSTAGAIQTSYGWLDPNPTLGEVIVPRNYGRGPGEEIVNLRLARTFHFGLPRKGSQDLRYALTVSISARNLLNHVNPGPIIGNINSPLFGEANQLAAGTGAYADSANNRRFELQARFAF
jgi:hypothetical protein